MNKLSREIRALHGPSRNVDVKIAAEFSAAPARFTGSVDACIDLLGSALPGWTYVIDASAPDICVDVDLFPVEGRLVKGQGDTAALAFCAALVRSRCA